ncbi:MAG TPA: DUF4351 domain-containing protein [Stenomitos sp.]
MQNLCLEDGEQAQVSPAAVDPAQSLRVEKELMLHQLEHRMGTIPAEIEQQIHTLSVYQLEALADAVPEFTEPAHLMHWLQINQG